MNPFREDRLQQFRALSGRISGDPQNRFPQTIDLIPHELGSKNRVWGSSLLIHCIQVFSRG
jgi:hypothetical protein